MRRMGRAARVGLATVERGIVTLRKQKMAPNGELCMGWFHACSPPMLAQRERQ
jgi:hypothetical protein